MAVTVASAGRRALAVGEPHVVLGTAAGLELLLEALRTHTGSSAWLLLSAAVAILALLLVWRRQDELRLVPLALIGLSFHLLLIWTHGTLGAMGDQDPNAVYSVEGNELVHGHYPESEYPVGAVLLFGLESWVGHGATQTPNRLLMVPFQLLCVLAIWGVRTRHSRWLAASLAIWPLNAYFWEYRFDLVPAALILAGLLLAYRGRWGWSGVALAVGASVKWTPGLSFVVVGVWLATSGRWRELRRAGGAFVATALLVNVPFLVWAPHHFLAAYRNQGSRAITNESIWYFPLRLFGLADPKPGAEHEVWSPAGGPHWADLAVTGVQLLLIVGLLGLAAGARGRIRPALAVAALAPATFLIANRIFSPQFLVVLAACWLFAAAILPLSRAEQLAFGGLVATATFANAFVYPFDLPGDGVSWRPFSAALFGSSLAVSALLVWRTADAAAAPETAAATDEVVDDRLFPEAAEEWRAALASLRRRPARVLPSWLAKTLGVQTASLASAALVATVFAAVVLPYRFWDSLAYGSWSRLLAATGSLDVGLDINRHRPLFYVAQGLVWRAFGYHEWLGRLTSVAFAVAFVAGIWLLARRLVRDREDRALLSGLATCAVLASSVVATFAAAGMADLPVAAAATATALAVWSPGLGRLRVPLVAIGAAATLLAKPTGLLALAGLGLAVLAWGGSGDGRRRTAGSLLGLAGGAAAALVYDAVQAHRLGESLYSFLRAGNADYWTARGRAARWDATVRAEWLGAGLRLVVLFGIVYAVTRAVGARPRLGLAVAGPVAVLWSILGPVLADDGAPFPFDRFGPGLVAYLLLAGALLVAPLAAAYDPLDRRAYLALLLWLAPGAVAWAAYRADEVRFLSPAWPGFVLLAAAGLAVVVLALARISPAAALAPIAGIAVLAVGNLVSIDGLGRHGWRDLLDLGPSGWTSKARTENLAYGTFSYELDLARANVGPADRIVSNDGRLSYFFPGRVEVTYPTSCAQLVGSRYVALLLGGESADFAAFADSSTNPLAWLQCRRPRLALVGQQEGVYASFVAGGAPSRAPTPSDCRIATTPGQLYDAVFATGVDYAAARDVTARAAKVGFQHIRIEHTDCSQFRVVIPGLPPTAAGQADFRREAESTGFRVSFVPAVRYPEVPADVAPVR